MGYQTHEGQETSRVDQQELNEMYIPEAVGW